MHDDARLDRYDGVLMYVKSEYKKSCAVASTLFGAGSSSGWSSVYTVETLMRQIRANFHLPDANGRIENPSKYKEYSEEEARAGWYQARIRHGWNN